MACKLGVNIIVNLDQRAGNAAAKGDSNAGASFVMPDWHRVRLEPPAMSERTVPGNSVPPCAIAR